MGSNLFTSALTGMNAAQIGLSVAEHNIANANTPGFSRQVMETNPTQPQSLGNFFLGQGVNVAGVKRMYDQFLNTQVMQEQTQASYLSSYLASMKQIDNLIADPMAGASPAIQEFFTSLNGVANAPESTPARQTMLGSAQFVVNRFQAIDQRLTDIANGLTTQITNSVTQINSYASQISLLNGNIKRATAASGSGQLPNDMLDQRDQLISLLNQEIKVTVQAQADGTSSVFIGNGQALVVGEQTMTLKPVTSATDPSRLDISYVNNNTLIPIQSSSLQGGNLGSFIAFRDGNLEPARNSLGRVALGIASSINQQNKLGLDLNGAVGGNIFNEGAPRVDRGAYNVSTATVTATISDVGALTTSDYQMRFDGTNYSIVRLADNVVTGLGATFPQTVDGFTINLGGVAPSAGDTFLIRPTANAARDIAVLMNDPTKIAAAAPMTAGAATTNVGTAKISAGAVDATYVPGAVALPVTLTYDSVGNMLNGFPLANPITVSKNGVPDPGSPFVGGSAPYIDGATYTFGGMSFTMTGTPSGTALVPDTFTVSANLNGVGDNRNALAMAAMQTKNIMAKNANGVATTTFQGAYGQLVGEVGSKTHELDVTSLAQNSMVTQVVASQQAVSGVNLDEEAANLMRYQKAYQAAAKAMQIANAMFDTMMSLGK